MVAKILVEVGEATLRRQLNDMKINEECMKTELDLLEELRKKVRIREEACKQQTARRYNSRGL